MFKYFLILFLALTGMLSTAHADNWLSWSEFDKDGENIQIYLSLESGDKAGPVQKITHSGMNISPSLLVTPEEIWIAWVDRAKKLRYRLRYARIDSATQHLLESGTLATSDNKVYAPVFALSAAGDPVLAWSGLDGNDEDIRLAYFQNGRWGAEKSITRNTLPDTLPLFTRGEDGELILSWERIAADGVSIQTWTLPSDFVSAHSENEHPGNSNSAILPGNRYRGSIKQLPVSLRTRQDQFLMGSRATALQ